MILNRMEKKEIEKLATQRGWLVESDQNGLKRVVIDGVIIASDGSYSSMSMSMSAPPVKVKKHRLTTTVKTKNGDQEVVVGDFDHAYEASDYASETNLPENNYKVTEVEVEDN